ncbi:MAG TPA: molybdopterin cofactor-binding domain-containing protein [Steroidobacteraceae bacterium]|jgi:isoquinoline 1-oxidoreductase beta subunit|nr:molybdopterin cofactor-binding domain-containing protein [Steroidobacteraceae bacterium]
MTEPADRGRRDFISAGVAAGGGLLLGLTLSGSGKRASAAAGGAKSARTASQLNAWLKIGADNSITIIVDRSEMGQGVYTALPMLIAEELNVNLDAIQVVAAPVGDAYVNPGNGGQVTGTSNSVQDAWEKLRTAGAQARLMLTQAAAKHWQIDIGECRAINGTIAARGKVLTYGQLAAAAAKEPIPKDVKLRPRSEFQIIGKSTARIDSPGKVDGSAEFGLDVKLPGMLYAAIAQSPVLGGKVKTLDSLAAGRMPGVRKILSTDSGVVVVADHFWQALQARKALDVSWDPGGNLRLDNQLISAMLKKTAAAGAGLTARADGDVAQALKAAQQRFNSSYELPLLAHATMEPMNCTADVKANGCDLYVGTQVQQVAQVTAAAAAGLEPSQVRVHTTLLGGGFGRRLDVDFIPAAVEASKAVGAPVKLIWTREDDMTHDTYRPPALEELNAGFDAAGKLTAFSLHIVSPSITARMFPPVKGVDDSVIEYAINFPYDVPNVAVTYSRQEIGIDVGYMRSVSHAPNCFVIESFMDELAAAAARNPYDFRMELLRKKPRHRRVLQLAAERAGFGKAPAGRHQGIAFMEGYTTHLAAVAEVSIEQGALKVHRMVCVVDCGQMINPRIVESQIESGIVFGLSAALWGEVTIAAGRVQQTNFNNYRLVRGNEMPEIDVHLVESSEPPGGIGEPAVALVAPAICNAIFAATGKRIRKLPIGVQNLLRPA